MCTRARDRHVNTQLTRFTDSFGSVSQVHVKKVSKRRKSFVCARARARVRITSVLRHVYSVSARAMRRRRRRRYPWVLIERAVVFSDTMIVFSQ